MPGFRYDIPDFKPRAAMENDNRGPTGGITPGGTGEFDPNDPRWNQFIQDRLNEEFDPAELAAQQAAASGGGGGGGGGASRIAEFYNKARQTAQATATSARQGITAAGQQYTADVAADKAQAASGAGVQAAPQQLLPGGDPAIHQAAQQQQTAMDSLAKQREASYAQASALTTQGATNNVNVTEQQQVSALDAESAMKQSEATASEAAQRSSGSRASSEGTAKWNRARKERELELRDQIYTDHGINPLTKERMDASEDTSKFTPAEAFSYMTGAYTEWLATPEGGGKSFDESRAGRVYSQIDQYAASAPNERGAYANAQQIHSLFFDTDSKDKNKWIDEVARGLNPDFDELSSDEQAEDRGAYSLTYDLIYSKGGTLNRTVLRDWFDAQYGSKNPLMRKNQDPRGGRG